MNTQIDMLINDTRAWRHVSDAEVRMKWECVDCGYTVRVSPGFYAESGNPRCSECDCEDDMEYLETEISSRA